MITIKIDSVDIVEDGTVIEIRPAIPFEDFPQGERIARPDETGRLAWYVDTGSNLR